MRQAFNRTDIGGSTHEKTATEVATFYTARQHSGLAATHQAQAGKSDAE